MKGITALLIIVSVFMSCTLYLSYENSQQIKALQQENAELWAQINPARQIGDQQVEKKNAPAPAKTPKILKIGVTSRYRLEDRYVTGKVREPEYLGNQVGEVVLNISVDWMGDVRSAKLQKATGITDEEVIEACKKAALKTRFNSNLSGTITYIFTEK